jgi:hypothetical protein
VGGKLPRITKSFAAPAAAFNIKPVGRINFTQSFNKRFAGVKKISKRKARFDLIYFEEL